MGVALKGILDKKFLGLASIVGKIVRMHRLNAYIKKYLQVL